MSRNATLLLAALFTFFSTSACDSGGAGESNESPTAQFSYSPQSPLAGSSVSFTNQASDPDGEIQKYSWDFDGDGNEDSSAPNPSFTFPSEGTYSTKLTVTDSDGSTATTSQTMSIAQPNQSPSAAFSYSPDAPRANRAVSFANQSSDPDGQIVSYSWDFDGDESADASGANPTYAFPAQGTYTASLTVTDDNESTATTSKNVTVIQQYNTATITGISITDVPLTTSSGGGWDGSGGAGPDIYYEAYDDNGNRLSTKEDGYYPDVSSSDFPLAFEEDITITDLSEQTNVDFYDYDSFNADDSMGGVYFNLQYWVGDYPTTVSSVGGDGYFVSLELDWSYDEDATSASRVSQTTKPASSAASESPAPAEKERTPISQ